MSMSITSEKERNNGCRNVAVHYRGKGRWCQCQPALCTRRRREIVEMVVPPGNRRGSDLRRTCQYVARFEVRGRQASGWAKRGGARGGVICETKRIRSHYFPLLTGRFPGFCTPLRYSARPHSILSMPRLCAFVEQITPPRAIRSWLEAAPTAFFFTEPRARREGRPFPRSEQVVRA